MSLVVVGVALELPSDRRARRAAVRRPVEQHRTRDHLPAGIGVRLRELDERAFGPAVPKPPTVSLRRWPLFPYPDPWWAVPAWLLGLGACLVVMRYADLGGLIALLCLMILGVVCSSRATRQMREAWRQEWQRLGQTPEGPTSSSRPRGPVPEGCCCSLRHCWSSLYFSRFSV